MTKKTIGTPLFSIAIVVFLAGCMTTRNSLFIEADKATDSRNFSGAIDGLTGKGAKTLYPENDRVVRCLDLGMLNFYAGQMIPGIENLDEAERLIEENYTKSITAGAASLLLNDTAMPYAGEDFEDLYLNVFKALAYAKSGFRDDAYVEIKRITEKLNRLEDKYKKIAKEMNKDPKAGGTVKTGKQEFSDSALARWISMILYRSDRQLDNAALDFRKIKAAFAEQPAVYDFPPPNVAGALANPKGTYVDIVAFSGRIPLKKAITYRINTLANQVVISMAFENEKGIMQTSAVGALYLPGIEGGYNFKCQVPTMETRESPVTRIQVLMDDKPLGNLSLIERMDKVAVSTFKVKEPITYIKTIIRTVTKGILAAKGKEAVYKSTSSVPGLGFLVGVAADVAVEVSEGADLRSGRYMPGYAWVGSFNVKSGRHAFTVTYLDSANNILFIDEMGEIDVEERQLNLLSSVSIDKFFGYDGKKGK